MVTAAELALIITAQNKTTGALNQLRKDFTGLDKSLTRIGETAAGVLLSRGVENVVRLGTSAFQTGIGFNAMREQADIAFKTMLGGAQQATAFLDELQRFAAKTPFEFPDLLVASQRMVALGFAGRDIIPILTDIGDAAAALGASSETINRIVIALGQMQARGRTAAQEMLQLTEAGIPAWRFLAEEIGTSVPEAMKKVEQGGVSAQTTIRAVRQGIQREFGGMMAEQSKTFNGMLSTLKDNFRILAGDVTKPVFDAIKSQMQDLQGVMDGGLAVSILETENRLLRWAIAITGAIDEAQKFGDKVQGILKTDKDTFLGIPRVHLLGGDNRLENMLTRDVEAKDFGIGNAIRNALGLGGGGGGEIHGPPAPEGRNFADKLISGAEALINANNDQIQAIRDRQSAEKNLNDVLGESPPVVEEFNTGLKEVAKTLVDVMGGLGSAASALFARPTQEGAALQLRSAQIEQQMGRLPAGITSVGLEKQKELVDKQLRSMEAQDRVQQSQLLLADKSLLKEQEQNREFEKLITNTATLSGLYRDAAESLRLSLIPAINDVARTVQSWIAGGRPFDESFLPRITN